MFIPSVTNVMFHYLTAPDPVVADGMDWYNRAHDFAATLDTNVSRAAGVIAAISPNTSWKANMTLARAAYDGNPRGLSKNVTKVVRILEGESPLDVLGGPKVRSFYASILEPDSNLPAVIDRHAFDIAIGRRTDERSRGSLGKKGVYDTFAGIYAEAATLAGITIPQMQAITWVQWKAVNGINI